MPKQQKTAGQKARRAARDGAKYTAELRANQQADTAGMPEDVAALLPPHMIALLNAAVAVEPGSDPRAVAQRMADALLALPGPVAAIIRPYDEPLSEQEERAARQRAEDFPEEPDGEILTFLVEVFYLTGGDLPDQVDQVARRVAGHWRAQLGDTGVLSLTVRAGALAGSQAYEILYDHRLDWDVRTPDPRNLVPPMARDAGPRPRPAAPDGPDGPMAVEQVESILGILPGLLAAIVDTGCRFVRTADGAIEQRSDEGRVCRWEQDAHGLVYQVVYDRDGFEDTRLLTGLTTLEPPPAATQR